MAGQAQNVVESVLAIKIADISVIHYTVQENKETNKQRTSIWDLDRKKEKESDPKASIKITLQNGQVVVHEGPVDQVRKRFDYVVNKLPTDTKEYLILSQNL